MTATVSIVMNTYNRIEHLEAAVRSVLQQTYRDFELVLRDDGSTDATRTLVQELAQRDARIRVELGEHLGYAGGLRAALDIAAGEYVACVNSDDLLEETALAKTVPLLEAGAEVGMVYTDYVSINAQGQLLGYGDRCRIPYSPERLLTDFMTFHFRLFRRSVVDAVGGIDTSIAGAVDYDLCLRLSEVTEIVHLAEPLYFHRVNPRSVSDGARLAQIMSSKDAIQRALERRGLSENHALELEILGKFTLRARDGAP